MTNKNTTLNIYIATIILIIILLIVSFIDYGKIDVLVPTGNVDIFDININCDCIKCPTCECKKDETPIIPGEEIIPSDTPSDEPKEEEPIVNPGSDEPVVNPEPSKEPEPEPEEEIIPRDGLVEAEDNIDKFQNQRELKIFENPAFAMTNKIAPGDTNEYHFLVRNNNEFNIKYKLSLKETNPYNMNIKYKLKLNGDYVLDSSNKWLDYEEINTSLKALESSKYDNYVLEWKWVHSSNDAYAGSNDANYKLDIVIDAEYKES